MSQLRCPKTDLPKGYKTDPEAVAAEFFFIVTLWKAVREIEKNDSFNDY
jgi:hypothetical protein